MKPGIGGKPEKGEGEPMMDGIKIFEANMNLTVHSQAILDLLNTYAADIMGNGKPLSQDVLKNLIPGLQQHPTTLVFLAFKESKAVGMLISFKGFSTFLAKPLINISDFFVPPPHRGQGIGKKLLATLERKARELGCCKITLDVQEKNRRALRVYTAAGFKRDVHVAEAGPALFYSKSLE